MFSLPLPSQKPPIAVWYDPAQRLALILITAIPPTVFLRTSLSIPVITFIVVYNLTHDAGYLAGNFLCGTWTGCFILMYSDYILLRNIDRVRRVKPGGLLTRPVQKVNEKSWRDAPLITRLRHSLDIWSTYRGIGWSHEQRYLPAGEPVGTSRWKSALYHSARVFILWLEADIFTQVISYFLYKPDGQPHPWHTLPLLTRYIITFLSWCMTCTLINFPDEAFAAFCIGFGLFLPSDFRPLFGSWWDAWSLRQFWGKVWHQQLRRMLTAQTDFIIETLNIPRGSLLSSYTQLYMAFFLSGCAHAIGGMNTFGHTTGEISFFMANAAAITFEDAVIAVGKRAGIKGNSRLLRFAGYLWTLSVFLFLADRFYYVLTAAGCWRLGYLGFSPSTLALQYIENTMGKKLL